MSAHDPSIAWKGSPFCNPRDRVFAIAEMVQSEDESKETVLTRRQQQRFEYQLVGLTRIPRYSSTMQSQRAWLVDSGSGRCSISSRRQDCSRSLVWVRRESAESAPRKHEASGTREDRESLIGGPLIVGEDRVNSKAERQRKDGHTQRIQSVRQTCRVHLEV